MFTNYLIGFFIFIFGVCIGSFLNCVIYRLETNKKINGRSFCPNCKHKLCWKDLFPVFSFIFLGGKCKYCKGKISWQYPVVEIATGILFLCIYNFTPLNYINLVFLFYIISALIIIFIYDLKHYIIPDKILFPAIIITAVYDIFVQCWLNYGFFNVASFENYFLATIIASGFFFLIFFFSKGKAMGFGDVKLAILMGLLLGLTNVLVALFLAFFVGALTGSGLMALKRKKIKSEIPFGPFLILGTLIALFYGEIIIKWYLNIFQI